ncbi:hypothetical protein [Anaerococcus sp. AGMB09787]|uniref:hypothetical protein n=1 Tax=Anaerococcus sp. AGMB09787 TaxID=2922869 RepID=UPI001FAF8814|nr:hypothetical protein [Anaerococcus sp. AGMB09787]
MLHKNSKNVKQREKEYFEESRQNFLDRMLSQNPGKLTPEEKQRGENFRKKLKEYEKNVFGKKL